MTPVLVVDDDQDTREAIRLLLEDEGYAVAEAADGLQTLEVLRSHPDPLVVLLDLDLPRLDGAGVLREVARDGQLAARLAFIVMTAVSYKHYAAAGELCRELAVPLIAKPFDLDTLLDAVAAAAGRLPAAE